MSEAARAYEALMVPAIFEEWTGPVLDAAGVSAGARVLDVACGTGVLARAAARRVGPEGSVTGLDLNPGMLAVASELDPSAEWRQGSAEDLPFPDAHFDAVVSQFGLMFFQDRTKAIQEMRRVLRPGGRLAVAVWDRLENSPGFRVEVEILDRLAGRTAGDALRAPFVLGDREELTALFESAGFPEPIIHTRTGTARFPSIRVCAEAELRGWLPLAGVPLTDEKIEEVLAEAEKGLAHLVAPDGMLVFDLPAHIVSGGA